MGQGTCQTAIQICQISTSAVMALEHTLPGTGGGENVEALVSPPCSVISQGMSSKQHALGKHHLSEAQIRGHPRDNVTLA